MKKIRTEIFAPHSDIQRQVMEFLADRDNPTRTMWVACGSKFGKTIGAAGSIAYAAPQIAIAKSAVSSNGRIDLLVLPDNGGEVIPHDGVPFVTEFEKIENPATRRNGSWGRLN